MPPRPRSRASADASARHPRERDQALGLAPILRAIADENRLLLIMLLGQRARTVKELQEATGLSQPLVSHHLTSLRKQSLVTVTQCGRSHEYSLCCDTLAESVRLLLDLTAGNVTRTSAGAPEETRDSG
ncbi:ArsR/SmtB family transcription factor [Streptomyces sp. GSL17-111]|uniref:ArsR/SmtB family transcription factor n=1 Tax=Streptomyces sp. GSL17-111 TaxID=3121596 RepID=UPI0030F4308D